MKPVRDVEWSEQTDVVVVGLGCAGAAATLTARQRGAEVVVVEMLSGGGGSSAMSGGEMYLGGGTPIQQACGFEDSAADMKAYLMAALGPDCDEAKIDAYCTDSLEHFDWLVSHGVPFKPSFFPDPAWVPPTDDGLMWLGENAHPFPEIATPAPRGHRVQSDGFGGKVLMQHLLAAVDACGATVHTDTRAVRLVVDGDRITGVVVRTYGEERAIRARRGVVLTTGGFVDNPEMVALHAPQLVGCGTNSDGNDNGSGILMAMAAGAATRHMSAAQVGVALVPGYATRGIVVNAVGQRFINEDVYPGRIGQAALFGHDLAIWIIVDEQVIEDVPENMRWGSRPHVVAETIAELEAECGFPRGALQRTVEEYNTHAAEGRDPLFHKNPKWLRPLIAPFGAINVSLGMTAPESSGNTTTTRKGRAAATFTIGGLHTDVDGRVLDLAGEPMPGLFAAGRASSGLHSWGYVSGTSLGDGTYFGRRAGRAVSDD